MAFRRRGPQDIRVVVSQRAAVADDAMRLAHDGAVEAGFMEPAPSGRRFYASYLNPGTRFIVAYANHVPIATLTVVEDGPFRLPSDRAFAEELDARRAAGDELIEAGSFAIAHEWRRQPQLMFGYILGTLLRLNISRGPHLRIAWSAEPRQADLLARTFDGEMISEPRHYLGAPAILLVTSTADKWATHLSDPNGRTPQRIVGEYALAPEPDWLECDAPPGDWQQALLPRLLGESRLGARLSEQMLLLEDFLGRDSHTAAESAML